MFPCERPASVSPWYHSAPLIVYLISGAIIALYSVVGSCACPGPIGAPGRAPCDPSASHFFCATSYRLWATGNCRIAFCQKERNGSRCGFPTSDGPLIHEAIGVPPHEE